MPRMQIEQDAFDEFLRLWNAGAFRGEVGGQRMGQAFYNHFELHRCAGQQPLYELYEADGEKAIKVIHRLFEFV